MNIIDEVSPENVKTIQLDQKGSTFILSLLANC